MDILKSKTILIVLFISFALFSCGKGEKEPEQLIRPVKVMLIKGGVEENSRNFPGKVVASNRVDLSFDVPGLLIELPILEGDTIKKGELIAKLDPEKYQEAVNETEAKYVRAKAQLERAQKLIKDKYLSQADYDTTYSNYLVTEADLNRAKRDLSDTELRAPFTGIIAQKRVDNFQHIQSKQIIATLHDLTQIDIEISVPENIMILLKQGGNETQSQNIASNFKVIFDAKPNESFPVKFKEFSSEADPETQTYKVVFTLPSPEKIHPLPGMTATIKTEVPEGGFKGNDFFLIPVESVFQQNNQAYVWKVDLKSMEVHKSTVKTGQLADKNIRVNMGVKAGDTIVIAGVHFLREGQKVKILP